MSANRQYYSERNTSEYTITTVIPIDDTVPQSSEGVEIFSKSFTPIAADSIINIKAHVMVTLGSGFRYGVVALFEDGVCIGAMSEANGSDHARIVTAIGRVTAGSTSARTYSVRVGPNTATCYVNDQATAGVGANGTEGSLLIIEEVAP